MIDFMIPKLGYLNFIKNRDYSKSNIVYKQLLSVEDLMNNQQRKLYLVFSGAYFYRISDIDKSLKLFFASQEINDSEHLEGLVEYMIARGYSTRQHFSKAYRHQKNVHIIFNTKNNYIRSAYVKLINDAYELLLNKRQDPEDIYTRTKLFINKYKLLKVENKVNSPLMCYYYRKNELGEAFKMLQRIRSNNARHFYFEAMIHMKQGNKELALKAVKKGCSIQKNTMISALIYKYIFDFVEAYYQENKNVYENAMKHFFNEAIHQNFIRKEKMSTAIMSST